MNWPTGSVPQEQIDLFLSYFLIWVSFWVSLIYKFCCGLFNFSRWSNSLINQPTWWGNVNAETHFRSSLSGKGRFKATHARCQAYHDRARTFFTIMFFLVSNLWSQVSVAGLWCDLQVPKLQVKRQTTNKTNRYFMMEYKQLHNTRGFQGNVFIQPNWVVLSLTLFLSDMII